MIKYYPLSIAMTIVCSILFSLLLLTPEFIFWIFSIPDNETARLIARRASILFLGFSILSFLGRFSLPSELRQSISLAMAITMAGLTILSLFEFMRGFAGYGILLAAGTETLFSLAYLSVWNAGRSRT